MGKRVTVMIDDGNFKKLREKQSTMIRKSNRSVSFSDVINDTLEKSL